MNPASCKFRRRRCFAKSEPADRAFIIVEFRTAEGQTIRFQGSTGSNPPTYRVGEKLQVRYDPQSPESAVIDSWDLWLPSTILIGAGGFFVLIGFLFVLNALAALLQLGGLLGLLGLILLRQKRQ
jgi:hypothetical protein